MSPFIVIGKGNVYWLGAAISITITMVILGLSFFVGTHALVFREMEEKEREGENGGVWACTVESLNFISHVMTTPRAKV